LNFKNPPLSWPGDPGGPILDSGTATYGRSTLDSTADKSHSPLAAPNYVSMPNFDNSQFNTYVLKVTPTVISWTVNGASFATFTQGSDVTKWPGLGPFQINCALVSLTLGYGPHTIGSSVGIWYETQAFYRAANLTLPQGQCRFGAQLDERRRQHALYARSQRSTTVSRLCRRSCTRSSPL
jgi:hypothetical protein